MINNNIKILDKDLETDILIVGVTLTGILLAFYLKEAGYNVLLVDNNINISSFNSKRIVSIIQDNLYQDIIRKIGLKKTRLYLDLMNSAIDRYEVLSRKYQFDFKKIPVYMCTLSNSTKLEDESTILNTLKIDSKFMGCINYHFPAKNAILYPNQAQINVYKLINELSKDLTIYDDVIVTKISNKCVYTNKYKINAKKIVFLNNNTYIKFMGINNSSVLTKSSYTLITTNKKYDVTYISDINCNIWIIPYNNYIIIESKNDCKYKNIKQLIKKYFKDEKILYKWTSSNYNTLDSLPYIGNYNETFNNLFIATNYNNQNPLESMIISNILFSLLQGNESVYTRLFNPNKVVKNNTLTKYLKMYESLIYNN